MGDTWFPKLKSGLAFKMNSTLKDWISNVRLACKEGVPNGIILNWNHSRFYNEIAELVPKDFAIENDTDFNYSRCNYYRMFTFSNGRKFVLECKISFICDAFCLYWIEYKGLSGRVSNEFSPELTKAVAAILIERGFKEYQRDWPDLVVGGIELELAEEATLDKILFEDFD